MAKNYTAKSFTPTAKVTAMTLKREGATWDASWKVPGAAQKGNKAFTMQVVKWKLDFERGKDKDEKSKDIELSGSAESETKSLSEFDPPDKWKEKGKLNRRMLHPYKEGRTLKKVGYQVQGRRTVPKDKDSKGHYIYGEFAGKTYKGPWSSWSWLKIENPYKPTIAFEYAAGDCTVTVTSKDEGDEHDWCRTLVDIYIVKSDGKSKDPVLKWHATSEKEFTKVIDVSNHIRDLQAGKHITVCARARAQGLGGDTYSGSSYSKFVIAIPNGASLKEAVVKGNKIEVLFKSKKTSKNKNGVDYPTGKWATSVQLQRRHEGDSSWDDVDGALDDDTCLALYDNKQDADPVPGEYIYYRVKGMRHDFTAYSNTIRADKLYTAVPKASCSATVCVLSVSSAKNGESAEVCMGFSDSTSNGGCELAWSDVKNYWDTNDDAETGTFTGQDSKRASSKYKASKTVTVNNLEPGKTYWFRFRRYREVDGETYYSEWSNQKELKAEDASDDKCGIVSANGSDDGTHATVVIGYTEDNTNTGTELSWSSYSSAWRSNEQPQVLEATWSADNPRKSTDWGKTQTIYLAGLEPGTTYYAMARRYLDPSTGSRTYSPYSKQTSFTTPTQSDVSSDLRCGIVSVTPGTDGKSATVVIGWSGNRTGCEVSWSESQDAWDSTSQPKTYEFTDSDDKRKSNSWAGTSTVVVSDLEDATTYYFRARTYYDQVGKERVWSSYTQDMNATPISTPEKVTLTGPETVERGTDIDLYWTVSGDIEQTEWHVHEDGKMSVSLANGEGALAHATIPPERYGDATTLNLCVEAGCGGGLRMSNVISVGIIDKPSCMVYVAPTLTAQPASFEAYTDTPSSSLLVTLVSDGITVALPDGDRDQLPGDVIWTGEVMPGWSEVQWQSTNLYAKASQDVSDAEAAVAQAQADLDGMSEGDEGYEEAVVALSNAQTALAAAQESLAALSGTVNMATIQLPTGLDLMDTGGYTVRARAKEPVAGLQSVQAEAGFSVAWAHQAPVPSDGISIGVNAADRTATITLVPPTGYADGDAYEIYRKTTTGYDLIAQGLALNATVTDPYAPFGTDADLDYIVACRTGDGDLDWLDYGYELPVDVLRFDFDGTFVELPWNLELNDSYEKSFERRVHLDGKANGYFDKGAVMNGSYKTDVNRDEGLDTVNLVRMLGTEDSSCFCRTQLGAAFECNVNVTGIEVTYNHAAVPVSISVDGVDLTSSYRVPDSMIVEG